MGIEEKFPVENFVDLYSFQKGRKIKLHTYKFPARDEKNIKGVVYFL